MTLPLQQQPQTQEDLLAELARLSKEPDGNRFDAKIEYKDRLGNLPILILGFDDVALQHLVDPEVWVPHLVGGSGDGSYVIRIKHPKFKEGVTDVGKLAVKIAGPPRYKPGSRDININWEALDAPDWPGPRSVKHPSRPQPAGTGDGDLISIARENMGSPTHPKSITIESGAFNASREDKLSSREAGLASREMNLQIAAITKESELREKALAATLMGKLETLERKLGQQQPTAAPPAAPPLLSADLIAVLFKTWTESNERRDRESRDSRERMEKDARETRERDAKIAADRDVLFRDMLNKKDAGADSTAKLLESMGRVQAQAADMQASLINSMMTMATTMMEQMRPDDGDKDSELVKILKVAFGSLTAAAQGQTAGAGVQQLLPTAGTPEAAGAELPDLPPSVKPIEQMIYAKTDPNKVAEAVIAAAEGNQEFIAMVRQYNGNVQALFDDYFGEWVAEAPADRGPYAVSVLGAITVRAQARVAAKEAEAKKPKPPGAN